METERIWEIDLLRAVAIILMVIFHIIFDLNSFVGVKIDYLNGFWYWEGKASALLFIFLAGISSGLSKNTVRRGVKVLAFGMLITLVTFMLFRDQYIRFGILHLLGTGMILFVLLNRMSNWILLVSAFIIALAAIPLNDVTAGTSLLLPFGVMYSGFSSLDYYPLSPYLSVFILGILAYKLYYFKKTSLFKFSFENEKISMISRQSLAIYLIHQPIIVGVIFLIRYLSNST